MAGRELHSIRVAPETGKAFLGRRHLALGRRQQVRDDRDDRFPVRALLPRTTTLTRRYWGDRTWQGDQGPYPHCVAYSALHAIENSPVTHPEEGPILPPATLYREAQEVDEWPGTDYDGTSVRAGAKVVLAHGFIKEYRWITSLAEMEMTLLTLGPVVVGTDWWYSFFSPVSIRYADGLYRQSLVLDESKGVAGGHAYLVNGINTVARSFRILNSWGQGWGVSGRASVPYETMERLLFADGGEAVRYVER